MAWEATVIAGSGINPLKKISLAENHITHEKHLKGTNVVCVNPEDSSAGGSGLASQITVSTSAVKLPTSPMRYRRAIAIFNTDATRSLYIGFNPNITTGNGFPIPPSSSLPMDINAEIEIYGVAGAAIDIRILELS